MYLGVIVGLQQQLLYFVIDNIGFFHIFRQHNRPLWHPGIRHRQRKTMEALVQTVRGLASSQGRSPTAERVRARRVTRHWRLLCHVVIWRGSPEARKDRKVLITQIIHHVLYATFRFYIDCTVLCFFFTKTNDEVIDIAYIRPFAPMNSRYYGMIT